MKTVILFTAETSDGKSKEFRTASQAEKFLPDWLVCCDRGKLEPRRDSSDKPLTATVTTAAVELDDVEAERRGLKIAPADFKASKKTFGAKIDNGKVVISEISTKK